MIVDLDERGRLRRFDRRRRIAVARRDRERRVFHRYADGREDVDRLAGNLVETAQHHRALDAVFAGDRVGDRQRTLWGREIDGAAALRHCNRSHRRQSGTREEKFVSAHLEPEFP